MKNNKKIAIQKRGNTLQPEKKLVIEMQFVYF